MGIIFQKEGRHDVAAPKNEVPKNLRTGVSRYVRDRLLFAVLVERRRLKDLALNHIGVEPCRCSRLHDDNWVVAVACPACARIFSELGPYWADQ